MNLQQAEAISRPVPERGPKRWARWLVRQARATLDYLFDLTMAVQTTRFEPAAGFLSDDRTFNATRPCDWVSTYRVFRAIGVTSEDVLADLGAGSGRALVIASLFPFRRLVGVELDPARSRQAHENLAHSRFRASGAATVVARDARAFDLPDDVSVVFLFNPFGGEIFRDVVDNVLASLKRSPRPLRLVYVNPVEHAHLMTRPQIRLVRRMRGFPLTSPWSVTHFYQVGGPPL